RGTRAGLNPWSSPSCWTLKIGLLPRRALSTYCGSRISPAHLYYSVSAPLILAGYLQTPRADGVGAPSSVPSDQTERAMRLQALDLWLLVLLLLVLQLQPVHAPRAQDVSLGVVSSGPLVPGIIESL
ncbi:hypothetical protein LEMLEM_LOCUS26032, partial [Lemmus lemmus]